MHFLERIQSQQTGQLVGVNPVTFVPVPGDPGVGLRMRTNHPGDQWPDNLTGPWRQLPGFQMHVDLATQVCEGFDQSGFAGDKLPVERVRPAVVDRYLMKFTRPKVDSDVRYAHAEVLLSLINQVLEMPSSADGPETSVREWFLLDTGATPAQFVSPTFIVPLDASGGSASRNLLGA